MNTSPWLRFYGEVPTHLSYPETTLYEALCATAARLPDTIAWDFFDTTSTYRQFVSDIDSCADALAAIGLNAGDRLLISMPTSPQGVTSTSAKPVSHSRSMRSMRLSPPSSRNYRSSG
jgi:long-chain acyl-CoA synthetase